ncbi:lipase member K isoform X5 [Tetranychus urticae]|uniref:lipase member K isoform X5 n=1 Tax=Tetranychus urticae TaxID=32264 RepID=UPI00077BF070|nr:lipase member K isoform X5 [Tetranychus urticae]
MYLLKLLTLLLTCILLSVTVNCDTNGSNYTATIEQLIESRGFNYEKHYIETKDGYILGVYRLINPFVDQSSRSTLKPIVLQHGFLGVGSDFLINAPGGNAVPCNNSADNYFLSKLNSTENNNLGFLLANLCYDAWISNSRGNGYSRNHTTLNPDKDSEFWKFTIDELIAYDTPAVIDYVLNQTGFSSLGWIGHSQGSMVMFGLLSEKPEYSAKVEPFIALAPVFYVQHLDSSLKYLVKVPGLLWAARYLEGELSKPKLLAAISYNCVTWIGEKCESLLNSFLGLSLANLNSYSDNIATSTSTSLWNLVHFGQNIKSGKFHKFDFGKAENERRYGQSIPPVYQLSKINSTSIALFYSKSDIFTDPEDVSQLIKDIQVPLIRDYCIDSPSWDHYDYLFAKDSYKYINSIITEILSTFSN